MITKKEKKGISGFWIFVGICSVVSAILLLFMALAA